MSFSPPPPEPPVPPQRPPVLSQLPLNVALFHLQPLSQMTTTATTTPTTTTDTPTGTPASTQVQRPCSHICGRHSCFPRTRNWDFRDTHHNIMKEIQNPTMVSYVHSQPLKTTIKNKKFACLDLVSPFPTSPSLFQHKNFHPQVRLQTCVPKRCTICLSSDTLWCIVVTPSSPQTRPLPPPPKVSSMSSPAYTAVSSMPDRQETPRVRLSQGP